MKPKKKTGHSLKTLPKGTWTKQLAKATDRFLSKSVGTQVFVPDMYADLVRRKKNAAKRQPKPVVVYMWTTYWAPTRAMGWDGHTVKREAEGRRTDDIQSGMRVSPLTRVELQRPWRYVKAVKR